MKAWLEKFKVHLSLPNFDNGKWIFCRENVIAAGKAFQKKVADAMLRNFCQAADDAQLEIYFKKL